MNFAVSLFIPDLSVKLLITHSDPTGPKMSLNDIVSAELAGHLASLTADDFRAVVKAASLGFSPEALYNGVQAIVRGEDVPLPTVGGSPHPLVIQAWSFVKDHGQYHDTYGLSSPRAGELMDLLLTDREKGIAEIAAVVTAALRQKGSSRAVSVTTTGMPGAPTTDHSPGVGGAGRGALKEEIRRDPTYYGAYSFAVEDTGKAGSQRFRVRLGGGLYATHPSKQGAIDSARICRKHGRTFPLIADRICLWINGKPPLYGDDIPEKVTFDGRLPPNGEFPPDPAQKDKTVAGGSAQSAGDGPA